MYLKNASFQCVMKEYLKEKHNFLKSTNIFLLFRRFANVK